jgi:phosphatidylserine/phosphatidylglycerophosphate/cardiolipin synthase-like enzyme
VPSSARIGDGYALVQVVNGKVLGLESAPERLRAALIKAAGATTDANKNLMIAKPARPEPGFQTRSISTSPDDIVFGGEAHEQLLRTVIGNAHAFVMIHSTFVGGGNSEEILDLIERAVRERGVRVDILWGKSDRIDNVNDTREACAAINDRMKRKGLQQFVRAHPFPTDSHAKILVADDGKGGFVGAIGSCNWLSTNFKSLEISLKATDPFLVSDLMEVCSQMSLAAVGLNGGIAASLAGQALNIRNSTPPRSTRRGSAQVILGPQHADFLRKARDEADSSIIIGSHRFGRSADNLSLTPTQAAVDAKALDAVVYYGKLTDGISPEGAAELRIRHGQAGMKIRQVFDPRLHAKFLVWDDDDVVITSHNLLSADPSRDFAELGVHLRAPGIGRLVREKLEQTFGRG